MKSKDIMQQELKDNLIQAFKSEDENAIAQTFAEFAESIQQSVMDDYASFQKTQDVSILAKRGINQLTAEENKFYQSVINAMSSANPKQAIGNLDVAMPETVIENVLDDIKTNHPLLAAVKFVNTTTLTKFIVNKQGAQMAVWGPLNSKITKELEGALGVLDLTLCKLSAFMPISKDMLTVGPTWLDAYIRATLSEATALALETAIVDGTGKNEPIGMSRDVSDDVSVTGGVYPRKDSVAIVDLGPSTYGELLSKLAKGPNGKTRVIKEVLLIVNPVDYFTKIMPATTVRAVDGTYNKDVFPYPTRVEQSPAVEAGKAVLGIAEKYFMGIGAGNSGGKIEYSDEYKFLEDERVYLTKLHGAGRALDDNAFLYLDISGLKPAKLEVEINNVVKTKEQA